MCPSNFSASSSAEVRAEFVLTGDIRGMHRLQALDCVVVVIVMLLILRILVEAHQQLFRMEVHLGELDQPVEDLVNFATWPAFGDGATKRRQQFDLYVVLAIEAAKAAGCRFIESTATHW